MEQLKNLDLSDNKMALQRNLFASTNTTEFLENWLSRFPFDKFFRDKFKIPIFSEKHKACNLIDEFLDYEEFYYYYYFPNKRKRIEEKRKRLGEEDVNQEQEEYIRGKGNFMKEKTYSEAELEDIYDSLDIDNL